MTVAERGDAMGAAVHLRLSQQKYLSTSDSRMHAVLTVAAGELGPARDSAEVLLVDCSGSMSTPPTKITEARRAAIGALDALPDGVLFAVVQGTDRARMAYPRSPELARMDARTRDEATAAVSRLYAGGGTAMGGWLKLADRLLAGHVGAVRHALLLTDGHNEGESVAVLDRALRECAGHFVCDARGIGQDWRPDELRRIASALRGGADSVRVEAELADDFRRLVRAAMAKVLPDLLIRVTALPGSRLRFVKQAFPAELELQPTSRGERIAEFRTGAWASGEVREYQLAVELRHDGEPMAEDLQIAVVQAVRADDGGEAGPPVPVLVHWTDDPQRSSHVDPLVAHYTGQADLNAAVLAGCDAFDRGDAEGTRRHWARAVVLAHGSGNEDVLARLRRLVQIRDAAGGVVAVRPDLRRVDFLNAAVGSNISTRGPRRAESPAAAGPQRRCPECDRRNPGDARFCECGHRFGTGSGR
ncbi:VWA domain-containing protein [Saccharopolyspora gloriosae]